MLVLSIRSTKKLVLLAISTENCYSCCGINAIKTRLNILQNYSVYSTDRKSSRSFNNNSAWQYELHSWKAVSKLNL